MKNHDKGIIILTAGMSQHKDRWVADLDARIRLLAGVQLYRKYKDQGMSPLIIISGGHTYGPSNPDLASVLSKKAVSKYDIPKEDIALERRSVDTSENAEFSREIIMKRGLEDSIDLVTTSWHLPRAMECFRIYGLSPTGISAEDVLKKSEDRRERKLAEKYSSSFPTLSSNVREFAYRLALKFLGPQPFRRYLHNKIRKKGHR